MHDIVVICEYCSTVSCNAIQAAVLFGNSFELTTFEKPFYTTVNCFLPPRLNLLFHALPENLGVRYHVYYTMVQVSGQIGQVQAVYQSAEKMRSTLNTAQPPPSTEQMQQLLRLLHQTLLANKLRCVWTRTFFV